MPTYVAYSVYVCNCDSGLAWPQARSYGCDPPLELEASSSNSNMLHLQLQLPQTAHRCSSFRNHRPVTQPQSYVCVWVCVCSGRKSENNCMKTRDGSLKEARTANAASSDERQTKRGRQQAAKHTHSCTPHVASWTSSIGKRLVGLDQSRVRRVLGSPANRIIPFVCTLMVQLRHLCYQDKVQLTQA